jgi:hypothetical protein
MSDERLPLQVLDLRNVTALEGRILVHGEEESSGGSYLLLEGTDAHVHYIRYTPEMEMMRDNGGLRTNAFIRLRTISRDSRPMLAIDELGDAELILHNKLYLREATRQLVRRGITPQDDGWNGWLGRYQRALHDAAIRRQIDRARDFGR